jgi:gliding motility-associated-like protein
MAPPRILIKLLALFTCCILTSNLNYAQDFSNKGKEFWVVFPPHAPSGGNLANLSLYITSDKNTSGNIIINGDSTPFNIVAFTPQEFILPRASTYVSGAESATDSDPSTLQKIVLNKGIKVVVDEGKPNIVVYAHMYANARSAASIILPTSVLERRYKTISYTQTLGQPETGEYRKSQFNVIAVEDNTTIKIQLRKNGVVSGNSYEVDLPKAGTIYSFQDNLDLTGTSIESISNDGSQCRKIAVFSGSSSLSIGSNSSVDPLFQQSYPINSWGLNYFITPFLGKNKFIIRVLAKEDNTSITLNGLPIQLSANEFKDFSYVNAVPFALNADKPICVAQFSYTQAADIPVGDPDMVILNSVEQNLNDVTVFLTSKKSIIDQNINIVIKDDGIASFKINGILPTGTFKKIPNSSYSYLQEYFTVSSGTFKSIRLSSDSGFNAFCYGFGDFESYAYSAGTNVKDLFQKLIVTNKYSTTIASAITCKGSPFNASITLPYKPNSLKWKIPLYTQVDDYNPIPFDSVFISGKMVYTYNLATELIYSNVGIYNIQVYADNPTPDGCSGEQEINFDLEVLGPPNVLDTIIYNNCLSDSVLFMDKTILNKDDRKIVSYKWDIGNGIYIDTLSTFKYKYENEGKYTVRYFVINDIGCISDTISQDIIIDSLPIVNFIIPAVTCQNNNILFTDSSYAKGNSKLKKWIWNFGDASTIDTAFANASKTHQFDSLKIYTVSLSVVTENGCMNTKNKTFTNHPNPVVGFIMPEVCLEDVFALFTDTTKIADYSTGFQYKWDFGDAANTSFPNTDIVANPKHRYLVPGMYKVALQVTSAAGCVGNTISDFTINGSIPEALFSVVNDTALCSNKEVVIVNNSKVDIGTVGRLIIYWDYDRNLLDTTIDDSPTKGKSYSHNYANYSFPSKTNFTIKLFAYTGVSCADDTIVNVSIVPPPSAAVVISTRDYVCLSDTLNISADITGGLSPFQSTWTSSNDASAVFANNVLSGILPGNIDISLKLVDPKKCEYAFNNIKNILVRAIPVPTLIAKDTVICNGDEITLLGQGGTIYKWLLNDIQIYSSAIDTFATALTGRYQLIVNDGFCNSLKSTFIPIKQLDIPIYTFSYNEYTCKNGKLAITTDAIDNSNIHLLWNFGDGNSFDKANPISHSYDSNGKYIIKLAVTNDYCPKYEYELIGDTVKVIAPLSASIFTLFLLADQDTLLTLKKVDSGYTNYVWSPIIYLSNPFIANPIFRSEKSIQYTLSRIDPITECVINDIYKMEVSDDIVVSLPKAFTPNGDNLNDKLKIQFGAGLKSFNILKIFNRFGKLVFQTININEGWDGKFNFIDQEMDAYTYFIDYITYKDEHITKTGSVILLR